MAEVGVVQRPRGLVGRGGDFGNHVVVGALADEWRQEGGDVDRLRADRPEGTASLANHAIVPCQRDRHAQDRKVEGGAATQFPVGARHLAIRRW